MKKKIVIALGGNALGKTLSQQMTAVKNTSKAIADLIEAGNDVIVTHGNGPQVGMIQEAMDCYTATDKSHDRFPLSVCVALSQAYIGYDLQNALREELHSRGINKSVSTVVTQVEVNPEDKAFLSPTKPIGHYLSDEEIAEAKANGKPVMEDAGRGYRLVVASPKPTNIIELKSIEALINAGEVVIACGGGGIPVISKGEHLEGVPAVIDKDFASSVLAQDIDADCLIILTAVDRVAINFGKPNQENLAEMTLEQAEAYINEGQFAKGSMLPKVQAAMEFVASGEGKEAYIALLDNARDVFSGKTGTRIIK